MVERHLRDRLQPSLLDRLVDGGAGVQVIDLRRLREILKRDLEWLLNTTNPGQDIDPDRHPETAASVLNYGVADVAGSYSTERRAVLLRDAIHTAILRFEPRIRPGSLSVVPKSEKKSRTSIITFDIHGEMWAKPLPVDLYLRSQVDLATGAVSLDLTG